MSDTNTTGVPQGPYAELLAELREAELLASTSAVLSWDQETMLPPAGNALRADQMALISGLVHERRTHPRMGELLAACEADAELTADPETAANLREIRRDYERAVRLPPELVREFAQAATLAQHAWREAREASDFAHFAPWLQRIVELSRERAQHLAGGGGGEMYDALLEEYEPGMRAAELEVVFRGLRERLTPLIAEIADAGAPAVGAVDALRLPVAAQAEFSRRVAARMGFQFDAGRLDVSTHPFCQGVGAGDTRLTTRYREDTFADALSSTMHEAGHGLYEQGLPKAERPGQPLSEAASLGIHESQSRLWENMVGRSLRFWEWALPQARAVFGSSLDGITAEQLFRASNRVAPSLIRVEADEATYNLHIMLRFDLERAMLAGDLSVEDLPDAWNQRMRSDLGLEVPDDRRGCLQDIHWSMGAIGYFPTYTLGNLYAGQLWAAARRALPQVEERIGAGDFQPLLEWLRREVHAHGRRLTAPELCARVTGAPLGAEPFLRYLEGKLRPLYGL